MKTNKVIVYYHHYYCVPNYNTCSNWSKIRKEDIHLYTKGTVETGYYYNIYVYYNNKLNFYQLTDRDKVINYNEEVKDIMLNLMFTKNEDDYYEVKYTENNTVNSLLDIWQGSRKDKIIKFQLAWNLIQ